MGFLAKIPHVWSGGGVELKNRRMSVHASAVSKDKNEPEGFLHIVRIFFSVFEISVLVSSVAHLIYANYFPDGAPQTLLPVASLFLWTERQFLGDLTLEFMAHLSHVLKYPQGSCHCPSRTSIKWFKNKSPWRQVVSPTCRS